jgi:hypothetical protein
MSDLRSLLAGHGDLTAESREREGGGHTTSGDER